MVPGILDVYAILRVVLHQIIVEMVGIRPFDIQAGIGAEESISTVVRTVIVGQVSEILKLIKCMIKGDVR